MMIALLLMAAVMAIVFFVWNYRRQAAAREAASEQRMKAFLEQARAAEAPAADAGAGASHTTAQPQQLRASSAPASVAPPSHPARGPVIDTNGFVPRAPLLSAEQRVLYLLLRGGLPDHEILARVSLSALAQPAEHVAGLAREVHERRLADAVVDFVVCDKAMKAVVAVQCGVRTGKAAEHAAFAAACVSALGMRWVDISPKALPKRNEIRACILGGTA